MNSWASSANKDSSLYSNKRVKRRNINFKCFNQSNRVRWLHLSCHYHFWPYLFRGQLLTSRVSETSAFVVRFIERFNNTATYRAGLLTPTPVRFSHSTHTHSYCPLILPSGRLLPPSIPSHPRPSHWLCLNATDSYLERACDARIRCLVREGTWFWDTAVVFFQLNHN